MQYFIVPEDSDNIVEAISAEDLNMYLAAPELYAAAEGILAYMEGYEKDYNHGEPLPAFEGLRQAIEKSKTDQEWEVKS